MAWNSYADLVLARIEKFARMLNILLTLPEFAWADEFFFQSLFFWRTNKGPTWLQCSALKYQIIWIWMGIETVCFVYIMKQQRTRRVAFNMCARQKHRKREKNWRLAGRRKIGNNFQSEFHLKWFSSGVVWAELKFIYRRKKRKKKKLWTRKLDETVFLSSLCLFCFFFHRALAVISLNGSDFSLSLEVDILPYKDGYYNIAREKSIVVKRISTIRISA